MNSEHPHESHRPEDPAATEATCLRACVPKTREATAVEKKTLLAAAGESPHAAVKSLRIATKTQHSQDFSLKKEQISGSSARCPGTTFISSKMLNTSHGRDTSMTNDQGIHFNQQWPWGLGSKNCPTHLMGSAECWAWSRYSAYLQKRKAKPRQQEVSEGLVTHSQPSVQPEHLTGRLTRKRTRSWNSCLLQKEHAHYFFKKSTERKLPEIIIIIISVYCSPSDFSAHAIVFLFVHFFNGTGGWSRMYYFGNCFKNFST